MLTTVPIGDVKPSAAVLLLDAASTCRGRVVKWFADGTIWKHLWITLIEAMLAFVIGSVAGVLIGFWFARSRASPRCSILM